VFLRLGGNTDFDRSAPAYVTDSCHVDQNPVIRKTGAFFCIDPPSEDWYKHQLSPAGCFALPVSLATFE
jgi:hypothetical protein